VAMIQGMVAEERSRCTMAGRLGSPVEPCGGGITASELKAYLDYLAMERAVASSTQKGALSKRSVTLRTDADNLPHSFALRGFK